MINKADKNECRLRRHKRVRGKIYGSAERPRLCVFRSLKHIYAQIINDDESKTLVSASSLERNFKNYGGNKLAAREIGKIISERAKKAGISEVVFDRGGYIYHGRVKELAEGARENGLKF
ncbi:MAG: 50S ribosomal protein L18 [Clostridia bacterium]|nr:50S ribosomal protein L18 [Clostridia bacterium]